MKVFSWLAISNNLFIKYLDYSCFNTNETGIPQDILSSFILQDEFKASDKFELLLEYEEAIIEAYISIGKRGSKRGKLRWKPQFTSLLKGKYKNWNERFSKGTKCSDLGCPFICFERIEQLRFKVSISDNKLDTAFVTLPTKASQPLLTQDPKVGYKPSYNSKNAKEIGDLGEQLVINYLKETGMMNIVWVAQLGEKPGYDIRCTSGNEELGIEVKATQSKLFNNFIITRNELNAAKEMKDKFKIALVTEVLSESPKIQILDNPFIEEKDIEIEPILSSSL